MFDIFYNYIFGRHIISLLFFWLLIISIEYYFELDYGTAVAISIAISILAIIAYYK